MWHILWRQREHEAIATGFARRSYVTPEWRWIWHASKIYGITAFMPNALHRNIPIFLEDNFLILEHKVSFGFVTYPSSALISKNRPLGSPTLTPWLSCQWSVAQQRDSRPPPNYCITRENESPFTRACSHCVKSYTRVRCLKRHMVFKHGCVDIDDIPVNADGQCPEVDENVQYE